MTHELLLTHERVDDIPLLMGVMQRLRVAEVLDAHLGRHGHHQGLSSGQLALVWLAYILSEGDHRKSAVADWVAQRQQTLEHLLGLSIRPTDFTDDRLGLLLKRLSRAALWHKVEGALWQATLGVYAIEVQSVRLDSTSSYGYHTPTQGGLMQWGHSKDHRPDLPQVKLMAAAAEPSGHWSSGHGTTEEFAAWVGAAVDGQMPLTLVWRGKHWLGAGYETTRTLELTLAGQTVEWTERVLVVRSCALAAQQRAHLATRLTKAQAALRALTPPPASGRRVYRDETGLQAAVTAILKRHDVTDLLRVSWTRQAPPTVPSERYVITSVERDEAAITACQQRLGWRIYLTTLPRDAWSLPTVVLHYRGGWRLERDFHRLKDRPLGIRPLYVRCDEQITGLTH